MNAGGFLGTYVNTGSGNDHKMLLRTFLNMISAPKAQLNASVINDLYFHNTPQEMGTSFTFRRVLLLFDAWTFTYTCKDCLQQPGIFIFVGGSEATLNIINT